MEKVKVKPGEWVITQGDEGDKFYIIDNGDFSVRIQDADKLGPTNTDGGTLVHQYKGSTTSHPSFGELALMYSTPRAASIIAETNGQLWALHRNVFRKILLNKTGKKELVYTLRNVRLAGQWRKQRSRRRRMKREEGAPEKDEDKERKR